MTDLTEGQRIYAIGDIHGRLDLLTEMLARIRADLAARPHPRPLVIFLGDYVDRGPDSRGVIEALIGAAKAGAADRASCSATTTATSRAYLDDPDWFDRTYHWLHDNMGGSATLASYGVPGAELGAAGGDPRRLRRGLPGRAHGLPRRLRRCASAIGGYVFVHAGIRPGVPLDAAGSATT